MSVVLVPFPHVQMCINLANERLQQYYQGQVFERERRECLAEGVQPVDVVFPSSQHVIDLFMEVSGHDRISFASYRL